MIVTVMRVELVAQEPISVSAPEASSVKSASDLPVAADPWGSPVIPVTGVVGSLRAHATAQLGSAAVDLFGGASEVGDADAREGFRPSALRFLGTSVVPASSSADDGVLVLRQTAVSRWSGAAEERSLRTREALPSGSRVVIYAVGEDLGDLAVDHLRGTLASWVPRLGGSQSVGAGALAVESIGHASLDLSNRRDLARWLGLSGPQSFDSLDFEQWNWKPAGGHSASTLRWAFRIVGDMRIGDEKKTQKSEITSLRHGEDFVIPGSAWKGVFRARAEFIARSCGLVACDSTDSGACGRPECCTCEIFGYSGSAGQADTGAPTGAQARVRFLTSAVKEAKTATRTHVAIDRFTGGARRGQLFTETVLTHGRATLAVEVPPDMESWCVPLLAWAAMDIHDGYVGVGHGTSRGMGSLQLAKPDVVRKHTTDLAEAMAARRATQDRGDSLGARDD